MNVFDLSAKISFDSKKYEKGLKQAEEKTNKFYDDLKKRLSTFAKVSATAVTSIAGVVGAVAKQSVEAYADYEQLTGGIEKLFGDASKTVMKNAQIAYKTAGLSANEYMETVTTFSASLINSLNGDTKKAAGISDMALKDMSDNVNTFGSDAESVMNAYKGFAKGNYTMLDNLNLGFAGSKEGMQGLLDKAEEITGKKYDISSLADIYNAIHEVQISMNIAGTTEKEAMGTISGSIQMTKSAWQNLLVAFSDGEGDINTAINNLIDSAIAVVKNIAPTLTTALSGIGKFVSAFGEIIAEQLPPLLEEILPSMITGVMSVINGLISALPSVISTLINSVTGTLIPSLINILPDLLNAGLEILESVIDALIENIPIIVPVAVEMVQSLAEGLVDALPELLPAIVELITTIATTLTEPDSLIKLITCALDLVLALADGITKAIPELISVAPVIIENLFTAIVQALPLINDAGVKLLNTLIEGVVSKNIAIVDAGKEIIDKVKSGIEEKINDAKKWGKDLIDNFVSGIKEKWDSLKQNVSNVAQTVKDFLGFSEPKEGPLSNFHTYAPDMIDLFTKGIKDNEKKIKSQIESTFSFDVGTITGSTGYASGITVTNNFNGEYAERDSAKIVRSINRKLGALL